MPFYIASPAKQGLGDGVLATHPPLLERVRILRSMGQGAGYMQYMKAYLSVSRKHAPLIPESDLKGVSEVDIRTPSAEEQGFAGPSAEEVKRRAGEIIRAMNDFIFITCPCGMKLKLPPEYAGKQVTCPRCKRVHEAKKPDVKSLGTVLHSSAAMEGGPERTRGRTAPQDVRYEPGKWQKITCPVCGHDYEISPCFSASKLACSGCGSVIRFATGMPPVSQGQSVR
jgi:heat shock protein HtpX